MATLGERLKREREVRGVSLSEISRATNIQNRHLIALEEDDFDALPGPVFVTGFLRAYSHHLGLDADKLLVEYDSLKTAGDQQPTPQPPADADKGRFSVATVVVALAIASFLLYLGWPGKKPEKPIRATEKTGETKKLPQPNNREKKSVVSPVKKPAPPEGFTDKPKIAAPTPKPEPDAEGLPTVVNKEAVMKQMKTKYRLVVSAKDEDVWVEVGIDNETTRDMFVRAGRSIAFRADKSITLTSGNARSMKLTLNGKPLDFKTTPNVIKEWSLPLPE